jgi:hypothetical protein
MQTPRVHVPLSPADLAELEQRAEALGLPLARVAGELLAQAIEASRPARPRRWRPVEPEPEQPTGEAP